jgi:hypothetical protein
MSTYELKKAFTLNPKIKSAIVYYVLKDGKPVESGGKPVEFTHESGNYYIARHKEGVENDPEDIVLSGPDFPETVYILAPGFNGKDYHRLIPRDAFVIAINKAIECPVHASIWLVGDNLAIGDDYFKAFESMDGPFGLDNIVPGNTIPVFIDIMKKDYPQVKAYFHAGRSMRPGDVTPEWGTLRGGATTASCALQLCYFKGAKKVIFCGVDFGGEKYFDGTVNPHLPKIERDLPRWTYAPVFNELIKWVESKGVSVKSISPTALDVEMSEELPVIQKDIFLTNLQMPHDVYIVATGPNGKDYYDKIPPDAYVIAVNKAIMLDPTVPKSLWMCEDSTLPDQEWFQNAYAYYSQRDYCVEDLSRNPYDPVPVFVDKPNYPAAPFIFPHTGFLGSTLNPNHSLQWGQTWGGCTIACRATQIACLLGARRIILVGVDMFGDQYYDGTTVDEKYADRKDNPWVQKDGFEKLIDWIRENMGIDVVSLSETALENVDVINPIIIEYTDESINDKITRKDDPETLMKLAGMEPVLVPGKPPKISIELEPKELHVAVEQDALTGKINLKPKNYPSVAYLCMSYDPVDKINTIERVMNQDYPMDKKVLYLMHQPDPKSLENGKVRFPVPIKHELPLKIVEHNTIYNNLPGAWWMFKLIQFLEICEEEITVIFDEDDQRPADYTIKAVAPLLNSRYQAAWNFNTILVKNRYYYDGNESNPDTNPGGQWEPTIFHGTYRSAIGTLAIETDLLREAAAKLAEKYPRGIATFNVTTASDKRKAKQRDSESPIDAKLKYMIQNEYKDVLTEHTALRWYNWHSMTSTRGDRNRRQDMDLPPLEEV